MSQQINIRYIFAIFVINLIIGNTVVLSFVKSDWVTFFGIVEIFVFNFTCVLFLIFLLRFYKNYSGVYARFLMTFLWVISTIFFSQGVVATIANIHRPFFDIVQSFAFGGLIAVALTFMFWVPIGLLNFFALSWIFRNKHVDQKTYNKNLSKVE